MSKDLTTLELKALIDQFSDDLFFFVRGIVKSNPIAEEIVSDVFVKLWKERKNYLNIQNKKSYLYTLARNESISYLRKNAKVKLVSLDELDDYYFAPFDADANEQFSHEVIEQINVAIESLPKKCKMAFSLAKISGLKYKEIGEIMGISSRTVKNHVAYALAKIGEQVGLTKERDSISVKDILFHLFSQKR